MQKKISEDIILNGIKKSCMKASINGVMVDCNAPSKNKNIYDAKEIIATKNKIIGKPIVIQTEEEHAMGILNEENKIGIIENIWEKDNKILYSGEIVNTATHKDIIQRVFSEEINGISIFGVGDFEKFDGFDKIKNLEIYGIAIVKNPSAKGKIESIACKYPYISEIQYPSMSLTDEDIKRIAEEINAKNVAEQTAKELGCDKELFNDMTSAQIIKVKEFANSIEEKWKKLVGEEKKKVVESDGTQINVDEVYNKYWKV